MVFFIVEFISIISSFRFQFCAEMSAVFSHMKLRLKQPPVLLGANQEISRKITLTKRFKMDQCNYKTKAEEIIAFANNNEQKFRLFVLRNEFLNKKL